MRLLNTPTALSHSLLRNMHDWELDMIGLGCFPEEHETSWFARCNPVAKLDVLRKYLPSKETSYIIILISDGLHP